MNILQLELRAYACDGPTATATDEDGGTSVLRDKEEEKKDSSAAPSQTTTTIEASEMRGVHATRHLPPNTVCMSIPRRCLITVEMGQATPIGQAVLMSDLDLDAPKHIFLMIFILWDRKVNGANSFFHPYYEILPPTLHNMPIFWDATELRELEGSYILHQIADRNQAIQEDYAAICQIAPQLRDIATLHEFKWARMCVCSRNFGLQIDGHRTSALVPHADMLNHYRPRETKWTFDEERQAFTITSLQHIAAGSEVLDSYGQKCNHRFLLNYGFAVEDNREIDGFCPNEVPLALTVSSQDICFRDKLEFWMRAEQAQLALTAASLSHFSPAQAAANAVKRVRVCVANNENARLLFSLLRALVCNPLELHAVSHPPSMSSNINASEFQRTESPMSLGGFSDLSRQYQNAVAQPIVLTGSPAPAGATYHRSCRDIRHPISLRNEREAMLLLLDVVEQHLERYPTTLAQDLDALADWTAYPRFSNRRHAKIQVRGEKEVLHHFATWATTALQVLHVIAAEMQQEEEDANGSGGSIEVRYGQSPSASTHNNSLTSFDATIRQMEHDDELHHTILRFCADVLGSLRREEFKNLRRRLPQARSIGTGYLSFRSADR